jgi:hypothetical protein
MDHPGFWNVSLANIITWLVLLLGFFGAQYVTIKLLSQRMDDFSDWRTAHSNESRERDKVDKKLEIATEKLTTLADVAERRLTKLENVNDRRLR